MRGRMFVLQEKLLACPLVHISQAAASQLELTTDGSGSVRREQMGWS